MLRFDEENRVLTKDRYRALLVGLARNTDISYSMEELEGLAKAAGAEVLGQMTQTLEKPNTATLIGRGKTEELAQLVKTMDADMVVFNDELTGMQLRNLEDALGVRVIDRTILILDIFAARASSREGKLQVELAQLKYRLPRLTGFGKSLSRLGGGIGTRGPGEKKLETDRRHIESRMEDIKAELRHITNTRKVQRGRREQNEIPLVALVGYTNSGKSALMNRILSMSVEKEEPDNRAAKESGSNAAAGGTKQVFEKDMLFATLDAQQRRVVLKSGRQFILIDTVGFVSKLPHSLIEAFKATLEEVSYADLLIQVVDSSYENNDFHIEVTNGVMREIGAGDKDRIVVYNKTDLPHKIIIPGEDWEHIEISAKTGANVQKLLDCIEERIFGAYITANLIIPYDRGDISSYLCGRCAVSEMDYREDGTFFTVKLKEADYNRLRKYEVSR